jgi:ATP synthase protein I
VNKDDPDSRSLKELEKRVHEARGRVRPPKDSEPPSNLGIAFRLSTEFVAAVVVGGAIGWGLDRIFGTSPLLLILLFLFGVAAGFRNVVRAAREMNENASK